MSESGENGQPGRPDGVDAGSQPARTGVFGGIQELTGPQPRRDRIPGAIEEVTDQPRPDRPAARTQLGRLRTPTALRRLTVPEPAAEQPQQGPGFVGEIQELTGPQPRRDRIPGAIEEVTK